MAVKSLRTLLLVATCTLLMSAVAAADPIDNFDATVNLGPPFGATSAPGFPVSVNDSGAEFGGGGRSFNMSTTGPSIATNNAIIGTNANNFTVLSLASGGNGVGDVNVGYSASSGFVADLTASTQIEVQLRDVNIANNGASTFNLELTDLAGNSDTFDLQTLAPSPTDPDVNGGSPLLIFGFGEISGVDLSQITNINFLATVGADSDFQIDSIATDGAIQQGPLPGVPEPASVLTWILVAGICGSLYFLRRRRQTAQFVT